MSAAAGLADGVSIGDTVALVMSAIRTQPDPVGITDSVVAVMGAATTKADVVGLTDTVSAVIFAGAPGTPALTPGMVMRGRPGIRLRRYAENAE
jgi:hypothetical protein